ncbi:MAG: polyphosphate kinase 2 family protein [Verrucomicrobiota bacterium]|nr:polyphosphate kinase 2 family protein [Verrucomicrobiota bacterium]
MEDPINKQPGNGAPKQGEIRSRTTPGIALIERGANFKLSKIDPAARGTISKEKAAKRIKKLREQLAGLQEAFYAEHQRSVVIVVQAMDTGGKDGAIKNLCLGLDPNGLHLTNFKYPSPEEWDHDFLWRVHHAAPRKGVVAIWNRSHYEDVLVTRVHKQISDEVWQERCEDINAFERLLTRNNVTMLKFFLHISKEEQKERLEARLKDPRKIWKFNPGDLKERLLWDDYQMAYEAVIRACTTADAPWHVVSANQKWSRNLVMLEAVVAAFERLNPQYPPSAVDPATITVE